MSLFALVWNSLNEHSNLANFVAFANSTLGDIRIPNPNKMKRRKLIRVYRVSEWERRIKSSHRINNKSLVKKKANISFKFHYFVFHAARKLLPLVRRRRVRSCSIQLQNERKKHAAIVLISFIAYISAYTYTKAYIVAINVIWELFRDNEFSNLFSRRDCHLKTKPRV